MKIKFLTLTFFIFFFLPLFVFAINCETVEKECAQVSQQECLQILEECVKYYENQIKNISQEINKKLGEKKSLLRDIQLLKKRIEQLNAEIQKTQLLLKETNLQIKETENAIQKTNERINAEKERLEVVLRTLYEWEKRSFFEILISEQSLSGFFNNLFHLESLNERVRNVLQIIQNLKKDLENQKESLEMEKERSEKLLQMQTLQKKQSDAMKKEKDYLLTLTEKEYQKYLKEKETLEKKAAEIRKRIFELVGIAKPPTFEEAYQIAKWVEKLTGVRPAFLLAILTQESNLGKNVGQCYLKNTKTGSGIRIKTGEQVGKVMAPGPPYSKRNDVSVFLEITKQLGRDPFSTPVSCPMSFGWGGAMGPAQFIPTTWVKYKPRLESILGRTPDPWRINDAFLAAGLFLADMGASSQKREDERKAALIYFSGSAQNTQFSWYSNNVLDIASQYERDIQILEQASSLKFLLQFANYWIQIPI